MMLCCDECGMWRLIYASRKLKAQEKQLLEHALGGLCFSCRSLLYNVYIQDAELPEGLQDVVFVRSMNCGEPCNSSFPQCDDCSSKPKIPRRSTKKK